MEDEELTDLNNLCADLVSLKQREAFPVHLLADKRAGEWVRVRELCLQIGLDAGEVKPDLFVTWLADPAGAEGYVVILFYDEELLWTMTAVYNRQRLMDQAVHVATGEAEKVL